MRFRCSSVILLATMVAGCRKVPPVAATATAAAPVVTAIVMPARPLKVVQTFETRLTIPGLFKDQDSTFQILDLGNDLVDVRPVATAVCADGRGPTGGIGFNGGIRVSKVSDNPTPTVDIAILYHWHTAGQNGGSLDQHVLVPIGKPADASVKGGCRLVVTWRSEPSR